MRSSSYSKKVIYLDLYSVAAYLALGDIYGKSDRGRALKMYRSIIDILKGESDGLA